MGRMPSRGMTAVLLFGLSVLCLWQYTQACSCERSHPQRSFGAADFAIKAKVKGSKLIYKKSIQKVGYKTTERRDAYMRVYHVRINKVFKESPAFGKVSHKHIYTPSSSDRCGVNLQNNTKYVLLGRVAGGKAYIDLCDIVRKWSDVRLRQRKGYAFLYERNSHCKVQNCNTWDCEDKYGNQTCNWNISSDDFHCYEQDTICQKRDDGQCRWAQTKMLKKCREDVLKKGTTKSKP